MKMPEPTQTPPAPELSPTPALATGTDAIDTGEDLNPKPLATPQPTPVPASPPAATPTMPPPEAPEPAPAKTDAERVAELEEENRQFKLRQLQDDPFAFDEPEPTPAPAPGAPVPAAAPSTPSAAAAPATPVTPAKPASKPELKFDDIVSEDVLEKIIDDRDVGALAGLFKQVAERVAAQSAPQTFDEEFITKTVAPLIDKRTLQYVSSLRAIDEFFAKNEDLKPYRDQIEDVAAGIGQRRQGLTASKLLEEAGTKVRKIIRSNATSPGFTPPGGTPTPRSAPQPTALQKDMEDLYGKP